MDHYERSKLADAIKETHFSAKEKLITQGDTENCNCFYILVEGEAYATLNANPDSAVMHYKPGDYFGELSLLKDQPRAANIIAATDLKVIVLERQSFKRLLGPLTKILKRNMAHYLNFVDK